MSTVTFFTLVGVAVLMLVAGLVASVPALALFGLFGAVALVAVQALAAGGDWIREASAGRFRHR